MELKEEQTNISRLMFVARSYLNEAFELLEKGYVHDAAEKVWVSVKSATEALALRYHGTTRPPHGVSWRRFVREVFTRAGLSEREAEELADYFIDVRDRLHGGVFYGFFYEEEEHRPLIEKARRYLELVSKLLNTNT